MHVVLVTGNAPYLGGHCTWAPLRKAMPDVAFVEIDSLDLPQSGDAVDELRAAIEELSGATAVVAHGFAAGVAIEAVANVDPGIALVLLSPQYLKRMKPAVRIVQALLRQPVVKGLLVTIARSKHRRLLRDPLYVRAQLRMMVRAESALDAALVQEARDRIADPRMLAVIENTADTVLAALSPIDPTAEEKTCNRIALGEDSLCSPMLESPDDVAATLRTLLKHIARVDA